MNSNIKQQAQGEREVTKAVHEFITAVCSFQKLSSEQKELFSKNIAFQLFFADLFNDDNFHIPTVHLRPDKLELPKSPYDHHYKQRNN